MNPFLDNIIPAVLTDGYKLGHRVETPQGTTLTYSNLTPRASREGYDYTMWFGLQYGMKEYLIKRFNRDFFEQPKALVMEEMNAVIGSYMGPDFDVQHFADLHDYGRLPIRIKSLPEGSKVPIRVPTMTVVNTHPDFFWATNYFETLISALTWFPSTSLTTAYQYRQTFDRYAKLTGDETFVDFQGHDFSFRGQTSPESAMMSGMAFLCAFKGTDSVPALPALRNYYNADLKTLVGCSVPATEHALACLYTAIRGEYAYFDELISEIHPSGIVSLVADTYNFWEVLTDFLPRLKDKIMARDGKVVLRPDSGDPVLIICGDPNSEDETLRKGAIEVLWDLFGGTVNDKGYKELDPHIGLIYGEAITKMRQEEIFTRLRAKGFASTNVVLGLGSMGFQLVTRDTYGWAIKGTYAENNGQGFSLFKDPATDKNGVKKSATGLLRVNGTNGNYTLEQNVDWDRESGGALETVFDESKLVKETSLEEIRSLVASSL
jgi:nicotinamide phosphoribosyltransferase